ncbi:MAG: TetR/AcrR family transcriptional regulator [Ruminococcus flavefaciens]|jgi:AcrR family transcriptional regulator|nr:TetR/AcrR family transcriptional regulator [Ruminococcus flavefaciens]
MNTKDNQRVRLTKRLLRESIIKLLGKQTIYDITVSQLCEDAGINRSTFYKYYNNIREIYEEIEQEALSAGASCIASVNVHDKGSIIQQVEVLLSHIRDNSALYTLLLENSAEGDFPYKLIEGTVGKITDMHELMPGNMHVYAEYCSLFVVSGSLSIIRKWLSSGMNESPRELAELILNIATGKIGFRI